MSNARYHERGRRVSIEGEGHRDEDEHLLRTIGEALSEWSCDGFVVWKQRPAQWLEENIEGHSTKSVGKMMDAFFKQGGKIDQVKERLPEYQGFHEYHYDFRFHIDGRAVYIETVLDETRTGPTITIVSMHDE